MSVYKRGGTWWFKFRFEGQVIRESAKTESKTLARQIERQRRRELEEAVGGVRRRDRPVLFAIAMDRWLSNLSGALKPHTVENYRIYAARLKERFKNRLVVDIEERDVADLQRELKARGLSARTINLQVAVLRMILRQAGVWGRLAGRIKTLPERHDIGRAISREDEAKLLDSIKQSRTPALLALFVLGLDTGLRASEIRSLRHGDLALTSKGGAIESGWLTVTKSKTEAGAGRTVPLTRRACAVLTLWLSRFPTVAPHTYVFPNHGIGFTGNERRSDLYKIDLSKPIGSWKKAWREACNRAELRYRWHDLRHTFVTRLAENPAVSEQTIKSLAGHVSKRMLDHYSHIRRAAKEAAIATLDRGAEPPALVHLAVDGAQNWAQSTEGTDGHALNFSKKALN